MIEIVINYDPVKMIYKIYEPSTDTLMASSNLTEALLILNEFLVKGGMINEDILHSKNISYHIDSQTMVSIIEGNINLLKRLNNAPSGFMMSQQRFGQGQNQTQGQTQSSSSHRRRSGFSGAKGFNDANKKFGFS